MEHEKIIIHVDPDIKHLVPLFLDYSQRDLVAVRGALVVGDYDVIRVAGHNMKGSGESYGFSFVSRVGNEMELAATQGDQRKINALLDQLIDYFSRLEIVYSVE